MNTHKCRLVFPVIFCLLGTIYAETSNLKSELDGCLLRLNSGVEKAFKDVGMTKEDVRAAMAAQLPPQEVWKPYRKAWPTVHKVREQAAVEMAALGQGAVPLLLLAEDKSWGGTSRGDVFVEALLRMGKPAVPALVEGLAEPDKRIRIRAITALGRIRDKRAVDPLIHCLDDSETAVKCAAVWALTPLADHRAADRLLRLWDEGECRRQVAVALGAIGDKRAVQPVMVALKECADSAQSTGNWNRSAFTMRSYASALGELGDSRAIPLLKDLLECGPQRTKVGESYLLAEAAADALRDLGCQVEGDREEGGYRVVSEPNHPDPLHPIETVTVTRDNQADHDLDFAISIRVLQDNVKIDVDIPRKGKLEDLYLMSLAAKNENKQIFWIPLRMSRNLANRDDNGFGCQFYLSPELFEHASLYLMVGEVIEPERISPVIPKVMVQAPFAYRIVLKTYLTKKRPQDIHTLGSEVKDLRMGLDMQASSIRGVDAEHAEHLVHIGKTRRELEKVYYGDGGIFSLFEGERYVLKDQPPDGPAGHVLKVRILFRPASVSDEVYQDPKRFREWMLEQKGYGSEDDIVVDISEPYWEPPYGD